MDTKVSLIRVLIPYNPKLYPKRKKRTPCKLFPWLFAPFSCWNREKAHAMWVMENLKNDKEPDGSRYEYFPENMTLQKLVESLDRGMYRLHNDKERKYIHLANEKLDDLSSEAVTRAIYRSF